MDFNVNVKITLEETPALINCFSTFIESLHKVMSTPVISADSVEDRAFPMPEPELAQVPYPVQAEVNAEVQAKAQAEQVQEQAKHKYTIAEIQSACMPLMDEGKLDDLAEVLKSFGASTLFEVAEEQYDALVVALIGLGAKL